MPLIHLTKVGPSTVPPAIGRISTFFGLGLNFRTKFLPLLNLGYSLRLKLPLLIAFGFAVSHFIVNWSPPRVELEFYVEDDEEEEDTEEDDHEQGADVEAF